MHCSLPRQHNPRPNSLYHPMWCNAWFLSWAHDNHIRTILTNLTKHTSKQELTTQWVLCKPMRKGHAFHIMLKFLLITVFLFDSPDMFNQVLKMLVGFLVKSVSSTLFYKFGGSIDLPFPASVPCSLHGLGVKIASGHIGSQKRCWGVPFRCTPCAQACTCS